MSETKIIYIAGKIGGLKKDVYTKNFANAEAMLKMRFPDSTIINPVTHGFQLEKHKLKTEGKMPEYFEYMMMCFQWISFCEIIYMLENWKDSKGALAEHAYSQALNLEILYE